MTESPQIPRRRWLRRVPAPLHRREFRLFWTGQSISMVGDQVSTLAVPLLAVLVLHADARGMGVLTAIGLAPSLLLSIWAGSWIDRRGHRRRTMLVSDLARALLLVSIPVAYGLGVLTFGQLCAVAFCLGTMDVMFYLAYNTVFVAMVPAQEYVAANALVNGSRAMSAVTGQSLAGVLVSALSAPVTVLVDALSFVCSAGVLASIHPVEPPVADAGPGHIRAGARFIRHSPIVRSALGALTTINYFSFITIAILVLYATTTLHVSAGELGLVLGCGAVGGVVGSAVTARLSRRIGVGPAFMLSCVLFPAPMLLVPLAGGPRPVVLALLFAAEFGSGLAVMILDISIGSIFLVAVPDELRARVSGAFRTVNYGARPLGALTGGVLGSTLGLRGALWIGAGGGLLSVLWTLASPLPRLRNIHDAAPDQPASSSGVPGHPQPQAG
jgi:MFS family permease